MKPNMNCFKITFAELKKVLLEKLKEPFEFEDYSYYDINLVFEATPDCPKATRVKLSEYRDTLSEIFEVNIIDEYIYDPEYLDEEDWGIIFITGEEE